MLSTKKGENLFCEPFQTDIIFRFINKLLLMYYLEVFHQALLKFKLRTQENYPRLNSHELKLEEIFFIYSLISSIHIMSKVILLLHPTN